MVLLRLIVISILAGILGVFSAGVSAAVAPQTLTWGAWSACESGEKPSVDRTHDVTSGSEDARLMCVGDTGQARDRTDQALVGLMLDYFGGWWLLLLYLSRRRKREPKQPPRPLDAATTDAMRRKLNSGDLLGAIAIYRKHTGVSVREAMAQMQALAQSAQRASAAAAPPTPPPDVAAPPLAAAPPVAAPPVAAPPVEGPRAKVVQAAAGAPALPAAVESEARRLMGWGQKIAAIKHVRDSTDLTLSKAKEAVEALEGRAEAQASADAGALSPTAEFEVRDLVAQKLTIAAIARVRQETGWDLTRARDYVERIKSGAFPPSAGAAETVTAPRVVAMPANLENEVRALLAGGHEMDAVMRVQETTGMGVLEARDFVFALKHSMAVSPDAAPGDADAPVTLTAEQEAEVRALAADGKVLSAIRRVREITGQSMSLSDAKALVAGMNGDSDAEAPETASADTEDSGDGEPFAHLFASPSADAEEAPALPDAAPPAEAAPPPLDPALASWTLDSAAADAAGAYDTPQPAPAAPAGTLTPEVEQEVRAMVADDRTMQAIKRVQDATGLDRKDAKAIVDAMEAEMLPGTAE